MIARLVGEVVEVRAGQIVLMVGGVGYRVAVTNGTGYVLGTTVSLNTYLAVRENALDLYGFTTKDELEFFELLLTVSGIGPKSAMGILSVATIQNLRHAIISGDTAHLTKVNTPSLTLVSDVNLPAPCYWCCHFYVG